MLEIGEISVRLRSAGGDVADRVKILDGSPPPQGRREIVLLIHGYANDQPTACNSFQKCIDNLAAIPVAANANLPSPIFKFYWPGDTRLRIFSALSYPAEMTPATKSGERLAEFLASLVGPDGTPTQVHIIAHSLGNRVTFEMLKAFDFSKSNLIFASFTMMAAAVPVRMIQDKFAAVVSAPKRIQALCSIADQVLHLAFPAGETAAFEGFFPEAVGRFGSPTGIWAKNLPLSDYGHGSYWPTSATAPFLANFLNMPVSLPPAENTIPKRLVAEKRQLESADLPTRNLRSRRLSGSG